MVHLHHCDTASSSAKLRPIDGLICKGKSGFELVRPKVTAYAVRVKLAVTSGGIMKKSLKKMGLALAATTVVAMYGCGGGGGGSGGGASLLTGVFLDAPVAGLTYSTATQSGTTNASGQFSYAAGETITFSIGSMSFPSVTAQGTVTPLTLANTTSMYDTKVINILRILQALDTDASPTAISIPQAAINAAPASLDFSDTAAVDLAFAGGGSFNGLGTLPSATTALNHFADTLGGGLIGTWKSNSEPAVLELFADGTFAYGEFGGAAPNGGEYGTYTWVAGKLTLTLAVDWNQSGGVSAGQVGSTIPLSYALSGGNNTLTLTTDATSAAAGASFAMTRQASTTGYEGTWKTAGSKPHVFTLLTAGKFVYVERESGGQNNGIEAGDFTTTLNPSADSTGTITLTISDYDDNLPNGSGIGDLNAVVGPLTVTVVGNKLTLTPPGMAPVEFFRQF
jgi:hypothetical protein